MDGQTDAGQSDPYVPLCFADDTINLLVYVEEIERNRLKVTPKEIIFTICTFYTKCETSLHY